MRNLSIVGLSICVLAIVGWMAVETAHAEDADEKVRQATAQFYAALNDLFQGELDPMKEVWSHADDVTYMGPAGGMQLGWDEVLQNWASQAALRLRGMIRPEKMQSIVGQQVAVTTCFEVGENINADGRPQKVSIRATNTFRKENGRWKMIGHHTDVLPFLQESQ